MRPLYFVMVMSSLFSALSYSAPPLTQEEKDATIKAYQDYKKAHEEFKKKNPNWRFPKKPKAEPPKPKVVERKPIPTLTPKPLPENPAPPVAGTGTKAAQPPTVAKVEPKLFNPKFRAHLMLAPLNNTYGLDLAYKLRPKFLIGPSIYYLMSKSVTDAVTLTSTTSTTSTSTPVEYTFKGLKLGVRGDICFSQSCFESGFFSAVGLYFNPLSLSAKLDGSTVNYEGTATTIELRGLGGYQLYLGSHFHTALGLGASYQSKPSSRILKGSDGSTLTATLTKFSSLGVWLELALGYSF